MVCMATYLKACVWVTVHRGAGLGELCTIAALSEGNNSMYRTVTTVIGFALQGHLNAARRWHRLVVSLVPLIVRFLVVPDYLCSRPC